MKCIFRNSLKNIILKNELFSDEGLEAMFRVFRLAKKSLLKKTKNVLVLLIMTNIATISLQSWNSNL